MHEWERIRSLPSKMKLEKAWRILEEQVWSEKESVWEMNSRGQIERDRRNERRIAMEEYIDPSVMLDSWGIRRYRESCWGRCRGTGRRHLRYRVTKNQIQEQKLDRSTRCRGAIEEAGAFSMDPPGIEEVSRLHLKKITWEARQIARYWGDVEELSSQLFKTVFRDVKNTDMNAIQHTTQLMIQSTQKSLKIVFQFKNFEHKDLQNTHTHTH